MKTTELIGPALDWAVAKAEGAMDYAPELRTAAGFLEHQKYYPRHCYQRYWAQGGPIIDRERIDIYAMNKTTWRASGGLVSADGPTALVAAMRCFVASKLGDEVEIPPELA